MRENLIEKNVRLFVIIQVCFIKLIVNDDLTTVKVQQVGRLKSISSLLLINYFEVTLRKFAKIVL